jgi:hypothetical protein
MLLTLFRQERRSLRLSASNIAATAGYHPWKDLPMLFLDLIYQGRRGQQLLQQDSENLSIEMIAQNDETALQQLAAKAGVSVQDALDVKSGKRALHSVQDAQDLKNAILKKARLTNAAEMKELVEGVRSAIDTSFGTYNEDEALDQYERTTGWPVTERNAEIMTWDFDDHGRPGKAQPHRRHRPAAVVALADDSSVVVTDSDGRDVEHVPSTAPVDTDTGTSSVSLQQENGERIRRERQDTPKETPRPFFSILGSIDGIREELFIRDRPVAKAEVKSDEEVVDDIDDDDDDSFCTRNVIVECKHRMAAIKKSPPLHDQIQTVIYMLMYKVDQADIIQVLRSKKSSIIRNNETSKDTSSKEDDSTVGGSTNTTTAGPDQQQLSTTIAVHRITLDDTIHQHRHHWEQTIVPRVVSFVDAVYNFRADDHQRYRLLLAIASKTYRDAWTILFAACPWLEPAETAFRLIDDNNTNHGAT